MSARAGAGLPVSDAADVDVDEVQVRVIADAAAFGETRRETQLFERKRQERGCRSPFPTIEGAL